MLSIYPLIFFGTIIRRADPSKFGVAVCSVNGEEFAFGDTDDHFCLQSCAKVFLYLMALRKLGSKEVGR